MRRLIGWIMPKTASRTSSTSAWQRMKMLLLTGFGLVLITTAGLIYVDRHRFIAELHHLSAEAGLKLRDIQVRGRSHISKDVLLAKLNLELNAPILSINLQDVHNRISQIGWVKNVIIERRFPSTIHIVIEERVPIALLQNDSDHQLIDATGTVIEGADPRDFTHLKVVVGKNSGANAAPILAALRTEPELFSEVWAISFQSERRWDVYLKNGMKIRLPESDPISAWSRLAVIEREKAITNRDLAVIDLRIPKQLIVEPNIPVRGKGSKT
jgi:cell division protein FtsQ